LKGWWKGFAAACQGSRFVLHLDQKYTNLWKWKKYDNYHEPIKTWRFEIPAIIYRENESNRRKPNWCSILFTWLIEWIVWLPRWMIESPIFGLSYCSNVKPAHRRRW
jgi:hypothetical protein